MSPTDPNEPLPTTPVGPAGAPAASPPQHAAPPGAPGGAPPGWSGQPGWGPTPPPPRRSRLGIAVVAIVLGGVFLVFFGFLFLAYSALRGESPGISGGPRVGVVRVKGGIGLGDGGADAERILKHLKQFADDEDMKAVVVRIDSPGGSVGPSQEIHDQVKKLAAKKTVVCSLGNVAASGGFYVAVACPKIVAAPGTLTGSIGVITQFPNVKGLAERFHVKMETVKSGRLKDAGNPFRDMTPEDRAYWQSLVNRVFAQFVSAVAEGRDLDPAKVREIADGRVLTGDQAKDLGLVDALGNFYDAVDLAKEEAKLEGEPRLVYPPDDAGLFFQRLMGDAAGAVADAVHARIARDARAALDPGLYFLAR